LAQRIATKKPEPKQVANQATNERGVPYWEIYSIKDDWNVIHTFLSDTAADAKVDGENWLKSFGAANPDGFAVRPKIKTTQVKDVAPDVAQNFDQPQDATQRVGTWAIYDVTLGREISRMDNVPWQQASDRADELELSTGHNMSVRGLQEGKYDANPATYDLPRRQLNVPELIKRGAIFVVDPHGENGWEPDAKGFSLVTLYNVAKGGWPAEARQHLKPSMYKAAESGLNRQGSLYDGKYNQILWSIKKLGIPDNVAFLDQAVAENFADGKGPGRPGDSQRHGIPKGATIAQLEKAAKAPGRKGQLARWQLNMRRGKKK
jgi:hypothetical protein